MARCDVPRRECLHHHILGHLQDAKLLADGADSARSLCPSHDDTERSLGVSVGEHQRIIWHCFAGCDELAIRAALVNDGISEDCLPLSRARETELVDQISALYKAGLGHAELRWRIYSLVSGWGGEMPVRGRYPGGRRKFAADSGVGHSDMYSGGLHR